jgi:hypothetical protein
MDEQVQLVEQPGVEQLANHRDRPGDGDAVDRRVVLQRRDRLDEVALQLLGVAPGELLRAARGDDLSLWGVGIRAS